MADVQVLVKVSCTSFFIVCQGYKPCVFGVFFLQQNMARMLYWGSQGIARDVGAAVEYYRQAALSGDAQALFDYGIILLKVATSYLSP